jgi:murein L,D-transpeptidase YcbB/YkuD
VDLNSGAIGVTGQGAGEMRIPLPRRYAMSALTFAMIVLLSLAGPLRAGAVEEAIAEQVRLISEGRLTSVGGVSLSRAESVAQLYVLRGFRPVWDTAARRAELSAELSAAARHGLRPEDFSVDAIVELAAVANAGVPTAVATFDIAATEAALRLLHHLYYGKVDPSKLDAEWAIDGAFQPGQPAAMVNQYLEFASYSALVNDLDLVHPVYLRMQEGLAQLEEIAARGGWPVVPDGAVVKPGMEDARIPVIRERLLASGDLAGTPSDGIIYDPELEAAVMAFQRRHGLEPDGVIGAKTYQALNRTVGERIGQMRVSLERARWTLRGLGDDYVLVNIAGAETYVVRDNAMVWRTRSVVGQAYRKTPLFQDEIRYVEINPTWTVPRSIFLEDKLPRIREDISYLARGHYRVIDRDGTPLDPGAVNWWSESPPVTLVQAPGADNALGLIKFMFPNAHSVYLHDTNDRSLFDRAERNLSSGCVRIEDPFALADLLLGGSEAWSPQRRDEILASGRTTRIDLQRPMPIVLAYYTAWVDETGTLQFREDVYARDQAVLAALDDIVPARVAGPI